MLKNMSLVQHFRFILFRICMYINTYIRMCQRSNWNTFEKKINLIASLDIFQIVYGICKRIFVVQISECLYKSGFLLPISRPSPGRPSNISHSSAANPPRSRFSLLHPLFVGFRCLPYL